MLTYNDSRLTVYPDGKLVISPVYKKDMGWYTCRPSNGVGEDPEAAAFLNVTCKEVEKYNLLQFTNLPTSANIKLNIRNFKKNQLNVNWFNNLFDFQSNRG